MITGVVIAAALIQLILLLGNKLLLGTEANWLGDDLIKVLGDLLTVLIALEVLQNITSYLRRHVVQIELVLVTALTAVGAFGTEPGATPPYTSFAAYHVLPVTAVHCADVRFIGESGPAVALLTQLPPHTECGPVP